MTLSNFILAKANGCLTPDYSCDKIAAITSIQASVCNTISFSKSGNLKIGGFAV